MKKMKKLVDVMVVAIMVFCVLGTVVFSAGWNISIDLFQFPASNSMNSTGVSLGVHTEMESDQTNKNNSISMAVYSNDGGVYGTTSLIDSYFSNGKQCETRIIDLPYLDENVLHDLVINTNNGAEQESIIKKFNISYRWTPFGNFSFIEKPHIKKGLLECSWTPVDNATSYDIYLTNDFTWGYEFSKLLATTNTPSLSIVPKGIKKASNNNYCVVVVAKSDSENISRIEYSFNETLPKQMHEAQIDPSSYKFSICGYARLDIPSETYNQNFDFNASVGNNINCFGNYNGYFNIPIVPKKSSPYDVEIQNEYSYFLRRTIKNIDLKSDIQIGTKDSPILLWPGDFNRDDAINMADILIMAKEFGTYDNLGISNVDIDKDKYITLKDVMLVARHFNATSDDYPPVEIISPPQYDVAIEIN